MKNRYDYPKAKKQLMELQTDPNPLNYQQMIAFREIMYAKHQFYPSEEDVLEIKQFFNDCKIKEVRSIFGDKGHTYIDSKGVVSRFSNHNSSLIEVLRTLEPELKIRMMLINEADMEVYIAQARKDIAKEFGDFFKEKRYENKETGEYPDWNMLLTDYYENYKFKKPLTINKLISEIKTGKVKLEKANILLNQMKEEVFLREEN